MTPYIEEAHRLLRLAERDLQTFSILAAHPDASLSAMCFHAQQSAEKSLKAVLTIHQVDFPRTHNLQELAGMVLDLHVEPPFTPTELRRLNPYAVEYRYDDQLIALLTKEEADHIATGTLAWAAAMVAGRKE
jgi:HEPN domain-containing protein